MYGISYDLEWGINQANEHLEEFEDEREMLFRYYELHGRKDVGYLSVTRVKHYLSGDVIEPFYL